MVYDRNQYLKYRDKILERLRFRYKNDPVYREKQVIKNKNWQRSHPEKWKNLIKKIQNTYRLKVITHYTKGTMKCQCPKCDCDIYEFLTIDHINNDGAKHRKHIKNNIYFWLISNNYPEGFTVLCYNCNCSKGKMNSDGRCGHYSKHL